MKIIKVVSGAVASSMWVAEARSIGAHGTCIAPASWVRSEGDLTLRTRIRDIGKFKVLSPVFGLDHNAL